MTLRLSAHIHSIFGLVFFVLKFLLGIGRQWSREKFAILSPKSRSRVRSFIYQTWQFFFFFYQKSFITKTVFVVCLFVCLFLLAVSN